MNDASPPPPGPVAPWKSMLWASWLSGWLLKWVSTRSPSRTRMNFAGEGELVVGVVAEVGLDQVAFADADEIRGRLVAEGPVQVLDPVGQLLDVLPDLDVEDHAGGVLAVDGRGDVRGDRDPGVLLPDDGLGG